MCWNPEVSLTTYLFSSVALILGYIYKIIGIRGALFMYSFAQIQLVEYFLWRYLHNASLNRFFPSSGLS
jgi:hypothetical protein